MQNLRAVIETSGDLPLEDILVLLRDAASILRAEETVVEADDAFAPIVDSIEDLRQDTDTTQKDLIGLFILLRRIPRSSPVCACLPRRTPHSQVRRTGRLRRCSCFVARLRRVEKARVE